VPFIEEILSDDGYLNVVYWGPADASIKCQVVGNHSEPATGASHLPHVTCPEVELDVSRL
jgi:hypothetical protein